MKLSAKIVQILIILKTNSNKCPQFLKENLSNPAETVIPINKMILIYVEAVYKKEIQNYSM